MEAVEGPWEAVEGDEEAEAVGPEADCRQRALAIATDGSNDVEDGERARSWQVMPAATRRQCDRDSIIAVIDDGTCLFEELGLREISCLGRSLAWSCLHRTVQVVGWMDGLIAGATG